MKIKPKTGRRELRTFDDLVEFRAAADDQPAQITGHIVYNRWSQDLGGFVERVIPGTFTKTLGEGDIRSLFNHDANFVLGRNKAGTLLLTDGGSSLRYDTTPPETPTIDDLVLAPMARGDVTGSSFSFRTIRDEWRDPDSKENRHGKQGLWERDLLEAQLFDVGPVTFPAYLTSDSAVRSLLEGDGLDFVLLSSALLRADRGIPLTEADIELVNGSIEALRSYLPEPEPIAATTPEESQAGRSVAHLRRLVDLRARELSLTAS